MNTDLDLPDLNEPRYILKDRWARPIPHCLRRIDGRGWKEGVKGSNLTRSGLVGDPKKLLTVIGGHEDCIDVVRGANYTFGNLVLMSNKSEPCRSFVTIKGGITGAHFESVMFTGKTRWWRDIGIGDYQDYGYKQGPTTGVSLRNVFHVSGRKVRILVFHGDKPEVDFPENYRIIKVPKPLVWVYFKLLEGRGKIMALFGAKPK